MQYPRLELQVPVTIKWQGLLQSGNMADVVLKARWSIDFVLEWRNGQTLVKCLEFGGSILVQAACTSSQSTHTHTPQRFSMIHRKVGNEVIQAHSIILAARSPVFERMFSCKGLRCSASAEACTAERERERDQAWVWQHARHWAASASCAGDESRGWRIKNMHDTTSG